MNIICVLNDKELTQGSYGEIKISLCVIKDANNTVKRDFLRKRVFTYRENYDREKFFLQRLSKLNLENIPMMIFVDDQSMEIFYKMVLGPSLAKLFLNFLNENGTFPSDFIGFIIRQVASAIYSVNCSGIVLNKLDKHKLIVDNTNNIIIFDLNKAESIGTGYAGRLKNSHIVAPEYMQFHKASIKQDVFCFGYLIYDLLCIPYAQKIRNPIQNEKVFDKMRSNININNPQINDFYKNLQQIQECMSENPTVRPSIQQIFTTFKNFQFRNNHVEYFEYEMLIERVKGTIKNDWEQISALNKEIAEEHQKREEAAKCLQQEKAESNKLCLEVDRLKKELEQLKKKPESNKKEKVASKVQKVNEIPPPLKGYET